jgi:hypothetical protein
MPVMPAHDVLAELLASGKLDAFAANRQRMEELARASSKVRVLPDNFLMIGQAIVVEKGAPSRVDALTPAVHRVLDRTQALFVLHNGDAPLSREMSLQALEDLRRRQALSLAYFDVFTLLAALSVLLILLIPLMRRSVAEKGAMPVVETVGYTITSTWLRMPVMIAA